MYSPDNTDLKPVLKPHPPSWFGAKCGSDKDQQCGLHSEPPAGINHCQDASNTLKLLFSWVLEITRSMSSKEQDVPDKELRWPLSFLKTLPASTPEATMWLLWKFIPQRND